MRAGRISLGRFIAVCVAMLSVVAVTTASAPAAPRRKFPRHLDPKSWEVPEDMSWADHKIIPGYNWNNPQQPQPPRKLRAALILGDFTDQKFRVQESTVDPTGQQGMGLDDPAQFWLEYLFTNKEADFVNHGHTVDEYWLENSYGLIGVDAEAFGPYTMDGPMYEYGVLDFGTGEDCPDGPDGCGGDFDTELVEKSLVDVTTAVDERGGFDFSFLLHSGYDESGVWLNFGIDKFLEPEDVTEKFGPPSHPEHRNWATTRYVDWTSFFAGQQIWSHALPGALSTQGESDGGSTYAHELSHILGVLDNYNNPYAEEPDRAYSGPWDMMSRGTFNGPGGPWERWRIPPTEGGTMGSHHMLRNKIRMGFTPPAEVLTVSRESLAAAGVVKATILQRETPPAVDNPDLYSGIRIQLGSDMSSCDAAEPKCDEGGYDFYDVEVVNRQGFDSFLPDHGVLIAKSKTADASPFIWVIDAHPRDLTKTDYVAADGTKVPYTVGDYRQLADAAFHAGTAPRTRNVYKDKVNGFAFYILNKTKTEEGWLTYDVAVRSLTSPVPAGEAEVKDLGGALKRGIVTKQTFEVTNTGANPSVYKLKVVRKGDVKTRLLNNLLYLEGGETATVVVWAKKTGAGNALVGLKAVGQ